MYTFLFDYRDVEKYNIIDIFNKPNRPSGINNDYIPGIILVTNHNIPTVNNLKYIKSDRFKSSIVGQYLLYYNEKINKLFISSDCAKYLTSILPLLREFKNSLIYTYIDQDDEKTIDRFVKHSFHNPFLTEYGLCMSRKISIKNIDKEEIADQVSYAMENDHYASCAVTVRFSKEAIKFFKKASKMGFSEKHGKSTQNEISGEMTVKTISNDTILVDIDEKSVSSGSEENVGVSYSRFNFHSHPKDAYKKYDINNAWPSGADFIGFYKLRNHTIFHCVATLEGVYIMSFSDYWSSKLDKIDKRFIEKNFEVYYVNNLSPKGFTKKINNILYEGHPIFFVQFLNWNEIKNDFHVFYNKDNKSCLLNADMYNIKHSEK